MKISVIIVAYKSANILKRCLDSIAKYNDLGDELEVIVVDNSPEGFRVQSEIEKSNYKNFKYIAADNKGFGTGNNIGAKVAGGEILAFLNPDIILIEPIFKGIYQEFLQNSKVEMLGVKLLYEDMKIGFSFYYDYKYSILKKQMQKIRNKIGKFDSKNMYIAGADMFVRKNTFFDVGMFDENIFMYYEEPDLTRRIRNYNNEAKIEFCNKYKMIHLEKKSTPQSLNVLDYEFDSAIYYGKKYGLDYKKKIQFEMNYIELKKRIYRLIQNKEKEEKLEEQIGYLKMKYGKYK